MLDLTCIGLMLDVSDDERLRYQYLDDDWKYTLTTFRLALDRVPDKWCVILSPRNQISRRQYITEDERFPTIDEAAEGFALLHYPPAVRYMRKKRIQKFLQ